MLLKSLMFSCTHQPSFDTLNFIAKVTLFVLGHNIYFQENILDKIVHNIRIDLQLHNTFLQCCTNAKSFRLLPFGAGIHYVRHIYCHFRDEPHGYSLEMGKRNRSQL